MVAVVGMGVGMVVAVIVVVDLLPWRGVVVFVDVMWRT